QLADSDKAIATFLQDHREYALDPSTRPGTGIRVGKPQPDQVAPKPRPGGGAPKTHAGTASADPNVDPALLDERKQRRAELTKAQQKVDELSQNYKPGFPDLDEAVKRRDAAAAAVVETESKILGASSQPPKAAPAPVATNNGAAPSTASPKSPTKSADD